MELLEDWARWMRHEPNKLGYPSKSSTFSTGGESTNSSFEDMVESQDEQVMNTINAIVHSLDTQEISAVYARYLRTKKPFYYELKLQLAIKKMLELSEKRLPFL
jgi:hypothetical protein